jgi:hypothetical protein
MAGAGRVIWRTGWRWPGASTDQPAEKTPQSFWFFPLWTEKEIRRPLAHLFARKANDADAQSQIHGVRRSLITLYRVGSFRAGRHGDFMRKFLTFLIASLWFAYVPAHANMMMTGVGGAPLVPCTPGTQASTFLARTSGLNATETNGYCNLINGLVADGTFSLQFVQNSASLWAWTLTNFGSGADAGSMIGNTTGSFNIRLYPHYSTNNFFWGVNNALVTGSTNVGHLYGASRLNSTQATEYVDTTANLVTSSSTTPAGTISVLADNNTSLNSFGGILSFAAIGAGLNATQQGQLYARVHKYMQQVAGAPWWTLRAAGSTNQSQWDWPVLF